MRYIDADALSVYFNALAEHAQIEGLYNLAHVYNRCLELINDAPTADVVEVVRCDHCDHFIPWIDDPNGIGYCVELQRGMPNNGFCCLAERKDEKNHE